MPLKYRDKYYNHFQKRTFELPPHYTKQENFLMRYEARFEHYEFFENCMTVVFFHKGAGELHRKDKILKARDNKFLVLNPNEGWEYLNEKNQYIDVLSFGISDNFNAQHAYYLKAQDQQLLDAPFNTSQEAFRFLENTLHADCYSSGRLLQQIYAQSNTYDYEFFCPEELTIEVLRSVYHEQLLGNKISSKIDAKKRSTKDETLKRLLVAYEFIHDNMGTQISIEQLSFVSSLSKFHLYDSFKNAFGKTPHQYINRLKVSQAKEYLQNGHFSVSEVSDLLGFSDSSVFSKVFKKAYGRPPSSFQVQN
jgi:AraC-like DNA-binding protein